MMVVVAIIAILAALSVTAVDQLAASGAKQNAASDLFSAMSRARAIAEFRGVDVYVIFYPKMTAAGVASGGNGAYFVYQDTDGNFRTGGTRKWSNFTPPSAIAAGENDVLLEAVYLNNAPRQDVRFGKPVPTAFTAPFAAVGTTADASGCSFCTNATTPKGAMLFTGDSQVFFLDENGAVVNQRVAGLSLQSIRNPTNTNLMGVVSATGLISMVK